MEQSTPALNAVQRFAGRAALRRSLALLLAWPLLDAARFAWSEMSFILFSILALMTAERLLSQGRRDNSDLIWAGAFTALAFLSRYIGVTLLATIVPLLALRRGVALPEKARRITIYALIAVVPISLWMLNNNGRICNYACTIRRKS